MYTVVVLLCLASFAFSSFSDISNGQVIDISFGEQENQYASQRLTMVFSLFVPSNTLVFNITGFSTYVKQTVSRIFDFCTLRNFYFSTGCENPDVWISGGRGQTCGIATADYPAGGGIIPCNNYKFLFALGEENSVIFASGNTDSTGIADWEANTYWYVGVGKESGENWNIACSYRVMVLVS